MFRLMVCIHVMEGTDYGVMSMITTKMEIIP